MLHRCQWLVVCFAVTTTCAAYGQTLTGHVRDQDGSAIVGASIELRSENLRHTTTTDSSGQFAFHGLSGSAVVTVRASGFEPWSATVIPAADRSLDVVLQPAGTTSEVTVSATRTELPVTQAPASVQILTSRDIQTSAPVAIDDILRQVAGFDLFRRTSSNFSNPTTQGVSLRGVGSSGASRAAVLWDGVPLNDPFGGWVYWDRVPRADVGSIEVLRGGASALYGSGAMSGVINVLSQPTARPWFAGDVSYGSMNTPDGSFGAGLARGNWAAAATLDAFSTDGYVMVDPAQRGAVDVRAGSMHRNGEFSVSRKFGQTSKIFGRGSWFREERGNGTPLQVNDTGMERGAVGGDISTQRAGSFAFRLYGGPELYHQSFSSIAINRNNETLSRLQRVPVTELGGWGQWSRAFGARQLIVAGADLHDVRGHSLEKVFSPVGVATSLVDAGGRQRNAGVFAEDLVRISARLTINGVARLDRWRNFDAFSDTRPITAGLGVINALPAQDELAFSPRAGANYHVSDSVSLTASAYRSFRAPTLNELYRTFRVGNVITDANSNLRAEHLTGGEAGMIASLRANTIVRGDFFWNTVDQPIANVTLAATPALITRQRQNLGSTRSAGIEGSVETKLGARWFVSGGYQYAVSVVTSFSANPALVGLWVPQVPHQQFTFQARFDSARLFTAAVQLRATGQQFDDDLNQFPLESYERLDVFFSRRVFSRRLAGGADAFIAAENLLNQRYSVGRTPVRTIAPPTEVRAGMRFHFPYR